MENRLRAALAAAVLTAGSAASAEGLTEAQARALIAPWYTLFNQPVQSDVVKTVHEQLLAPNYQPCWGVLPAECWAADQSVQAVAVFAETNPHMGCAITQALGA